MSVLFSTSLNFSYRIISLFKILVQLTNLVSSSICVFLSLFENECCCSCATKIFAAKYKFWFTKAKNK